MDVRHHAFQDVRIGTEGEGGSPQVSDQNGKVRLRLAPATKPDAWVTLMIAQSPKGMDLDFISPLDGRVRVPPFENESENYSPVYLARHHDKEILEMGAGLLALHATINRSVAARLAKRSGALLMQQNEKLAVKYVPAHIEFLFAGSGGDRPKGQIEDEDLYKAALAETSNKFGFTPQEIDAAFRSWGGDPLTWKIVDLSGLLDTGGPNPFETVSSLGSLHDISFGVARSSIRTCTFQRLLQGFRDNDSALFDSVVGSDRKSLIALLQSPCPKFYEFAAAKMLDSFGTLIEPWKTRLIALAQEPSFQRVQVEQLVPSVQQARLKASELGLSSERAVAFLYDFTIQHGLVALRHSQQFYRADISAFTTTTGRQPDEVERLLLLVNRGAQRNWLGREAVGDPWRERALLMALGSCRVFGRDYDLDALGIGLRSFATGQAIIVHNDQIILDKLKSGWLPAGAPLGGPNV